MLKNKIKGRIYTEDLLLFNKVITLRDSQHHRIVNVMRSRVGDVFVLFNNRDGEYEVEVIDVERRKVSFRCIAKIRDSYDELSLWVLFSPLRAERNDYLAQKMCELGVTDIVPIQTERCVANFKEKRFSSGLVSGSEQCERLSLPRLHPLYNNILSALSILPKKCALIFLDESGNGKPILESLEKIRESSKKYDSYGIIVGSEGGFSSLEAEQINSYRNSYATTLGPRILRADTAIVSSLSCLQALLGDWKLKPRFNL